MEDEERMINNLREECNSLEEALEREKTAHTSFSIDIIILFLIFCFYLNM